MKARQRAAFVAPVLAAALLISGCSGDGNDSGGDDSSQAPKVAQDLQPTQREQLAQGGEIRQAVTLFGPSWNPLSRDGDSADMEKVLRPLMPHFFEYDEAGRPKPNPDYLLEATDNGADPLVVTYKLNPEAKWNDKSPITADDFIATWKACNGTDPDFECATTKGFEDIADIKAGVDEFEVVMTYKSTYPDWAETFPTVLKAESAKDPKTFNDGWKAAKNEWFSGPFVVKEHDTAEQIVTESPNSAWWGDQPLVEQLTFRSVPKADRAQAYVDNKLDVLDVGLNPDAYGQAKSAGGSVIRMAAGPEMRQLVLNRTDGPLKDQVVRQSIARALDRSAIATSDLAGMDWQPNPVGNNILTENQEGYAANAGEADITFDPEKAKKDLEKAGWKAAEDGSRTKDGEKLEITLTLPADDKVAQNELDEITAMLKKIGITVKADKLEGSELNKAVADESYEMIVHTRQLSPSPETELAELYGTDGARNWSNLAAPEVDDLIKKIAVEKDPQARTAQLNQLDTLLWKDAGTLPLYQQPEMVAVPTSLGNFGAQGLSTSSAEDWGYKK